MTTDQAIEPQLAATRTSMSESQPQSEPAPEGISLDELTEAFAQVMGGEGRGESQSEDGPAVSQTESVGITQRAAEAPVPQSPASDDDPCEISPRTILEAMLFVGNRDGQSLSARRAAARGPAPGPRLP